jgi:hypothetical protein
MKGFISSVLDFLAGWRRAPRQQSLPLGVAVKHAEPGGGVDPHELAADLEAVARACEKAGGFSRSDIVKRTKLGKDVVKRRLQVLLELGWIEREKYGNYLWKGRVFWEGASR